MARRRAHGSISSTRCRFSDASDVELLNCLASGEEHLSAVEVVLRHAAPALGVRFGRDAVAPPHLLHLHQLEPVPLKERDVLAPHLPAHEERPAALDEVPYELTIAAMPVPLTRD